MKKPIARISLALIVAATVGLGARCGGNDVGGGEDASGQDTPGQDGAADTPLNPDADDTGGGDVTPPLECDDGLFCNGLESWDPKEERCQQGTPPVIDDGVACTVDRCDEDNDTVVHEADDALCSNDNACDGLETCDPFNDCQPGDPAAVDDGVDCTLDTCDSDSGAVAHVPDDALCSNGVYCDGAETCDPVAGCIPGAALPIDDGVACTVDTCDEAGQQIRHTPDHSVCDNGDFCDGAEFCDPTDDCLPGDAPPLDDGVACTTDICNENDDVVSHIPNDVACDNGLFCDGIETCDPIADCQPGAAPLLDDDVDCTVDSCDEEFDTIAHAPDAALCDNGLFCDGAETCDPFADCQAGLAPGLDDGVDCTADACDEDNDVVAHTVDDAFCDNGDFCDGAEICDSAAGCLPGEAPTLDDAVDCTADACDEDNDVVTHTPDDTLCDNGEFCDGAETCDLVAGCQAGTAPVIDDDIVCTADACDEDNDVVTHTPDDTLCDNGEFCDGAETCDGVAGCQAGTAPVLDDGIACTADACDETNDEVTHTPDDTLCDNGEFCDGAEWCSIDAGGCAPGRSPAEGTECLAAEPEGVHSICIAGACVLSDCGDGFIDLTTGEECDDANTDEGDGCSTACVALAYCEGAAGYAELSGETTTFAATGTTSGPSRFAGTCGASGGAPDQVYGVTLDYVAASFTVSLAGSNYDTVLYVRQGDCLTGAQLGCNDDYSGVQSYLAFDCLLPGFYYVFVDGYGSSAGNYNLAIEATPLAEGEACCGDGVLGGTEACDDGNRIPGDGCEPDCTITPCGNGVLDEGEICDDGNRIDGDGCESDCTLTPVCGNSLIEAGEWCDDGNIEPNDGCDPDCTPPDCADTIDNDNDGPIDAGEDFGCESPNDSTEWPEIDDCVDGVDIDHDGETDEDGVCSSAPPTAVCPADVDVYALQTVTLVGEAADDHFVDRVHWEITEAPFGSSWQPTNPWNLQTDFTPDLAGTFVLTFHVWDDIGQQASCTTTVNAVIGDDFRVELFWNPGVEGDPTDIDLHLLHADAPGWFSSEWDCYYGNCVGGFAGTWGTEDPNARPRLDIDDVDGNGPENSNILVVQTDLRYRVGVHYYSDDGWGPSQVYVRIYCYGIESALFGPVTMNGASSSTSNDFWRVADVTFGDTGCNVVDLAVEGVPNIVLASEAQTTP